MRSLCYFSWVYLEIITDITALSAEVCGSSVRRSLELRELVTHRVALSRVMLPAITLSDLTWSSLVTANSSILLSAMSKSGGKKSQNIHFFIHSNYILFGLQSSEEFSVSNLNSSSELICSVKDKLCQECDNVHRTFLKVLFFNKRFPSRTN